MSTVLFKHLFTLHKLNLVLHVLGMINFMMFFLTNVQHAKVVSILILQNINVSTGSKNLQTMKLVVGRLSILLRF